MTQEVNETKRTNRVTNLHQYVSEINKIHPEVTVLGEYINSKTKIEHRCKCGNIFSALPLNMLRAKGGRCKECAADLRSKNDRKSNVVFQQEIYEIVQDEYTVLEEYKGASVNIRFRHNKCGHEWRARPSNFFTGHRCPKCAGVLPRTTNQFIKEVYSITKNDYSVLGECGSSKTKIEMRHNVCGHTYFIAPIHFIRGKRCPSCFGTPKKTNEQFKQEVLEAVGFDYEVLGEYKSNNTHIEIKHNVCGKVYSVLPSNFLLKKSRCPYCYQSKGENKISDYLIDKKILFNIEKTFPDCKNVGLLSFDFQLRKHILVEYDGGQHFFPVDFAGKGEDWANENYNYTLNNDKIKNQYCINNNIPLIRIPYWEFDNIDIIIELTLMHYNITPRKDSYDFSLIAEWIVDSKWDHDEYIAKCPKLKTSHK